MSKPAIHGRDHRPGGADPIPNFGWQFDVFNIGGWGYVQTDECLDVDTTPDPMAIGGMWGLVFADNSGCGAAFGSDTGDVLIKSRTGQTQIQSGSSPLTVIVNGQTFSFKDDGTIELPGGGIIGP